MIQFKTVQEAFEWTFNEREDMQQLRIDFNLNDEFENVKDVISMIEEHVLEDYLLDNSYLIPYEDGYAFYEEEDYENDYDDALRFELAGILGENED
ncbi:hypothetical protein H6K86_12000 [Staphylococcus epidermidis]|nr:hypothetical protein [Staphylococcus epidermidis]MBM6209898.1 hypothetical protein [Staphylococcus epidermidis]MBM6212255.1 hypothetical protein [Staphylococcus epidermidis]MBM6219282.1 hypothetical protein [Staphylococcus epidermidis]MBM6223804.1 hypothetical protein [Staphylococcus epidermidis]